MKHWSELLKDIQIGMNALIIKYRTDKNEIHLLNISRLWSWKQDILHFNDVADGKTIQKMTEEYNSCPAYSKSLTHDEAVARMYRRRKGESLYI